MIVEVRGGDHVRHRRQDVAPRAPGARRRIRARSATRRPACAPTPASACSCPTRWRAATCGPCRSRPRPDLPRADLGARRLRRADRGARGGAPPDPGRTPAPTPRRWPSRSPPRSTRSPRGGSDAADVGVLGGGPMGLMLTSLLVAQGRNVTRRRPARRNGAPRRTELGATRRQEHLTPATSSCSRPSAAPRPGAPPPRRPRPAASWCSSAAARAGPRSASDRPAPLRGARAARLVPPLARRGRRGAAPCSPPTRPCGARSAARRSRSSSCRTRSARPTGGPAKKWVVDPRATASRLNSRCSTIRRESQIASPSITSTGTRR